MFDFLLGNILLRKPLLNTNLLLYILCIHFALKQNNRETNLLLKIDYTQLLRFIQRDLRDGVYPLNFVYGYTTHEKKKHIATHTTAEYCECQESTRRALE